MSQLPNFYPYMLPDYHTNGGYMHVPPQNMQAQNMQAQNMQAQNMQAQNMQAQNMQAQNMHAQNMHAQNMHAQNTLAQNTLAQNIAGQNIHAPNMMPQAGYCNHYSNPQYANAIHFAVNDILYGTDVNSETQWLQRLYRRLMKREVELGKKQKK
jgi:hypothetical protein